MRARAAAFGAAVCFAAAGAAGTVGCAATPPPEAATAASARPTPADEAASVRRFVEDEERLLRQLSVADPRLAVRFGIEPSEDELRKVAVSALLADDESLAIEGRSLDLFAFDARGRVLSAVGEEVVRASDPLPEAPHLERDLLRRIVIAERARVERERGLGVGAVGLLRGIATAWVKPHNADEAKVRARIVARRLGEVRASLSAAKLSLLERDALDDALDPLERLASDAGLAEANAGIAALRVELGNLRTVPSRAASADDLARLVVAATGSTQPAKAVGDALASSEAALREALKPRLASLAQGARVAVLAQAGELLREAGGCPSPVRGSRVRAAVPPPERAGVREIVCIVHASRTDAEETAALVVAHDHVAVALWAFDIHARGIEPYRAEDAHALLASLTPEYGTRRLRAATADAAAAIAGGMAVELLLRDGLERMKPRASAWLAFGDAPLDVVAARALATPSGADGSKPASSPPQASPRP